MTTPFSDEVPDSAGRISPRHVFETRVRIGLQRDGQSLTLQGWTRNLSEGGLNAFVAQALALGAFVTLEIPLPGSRQHVIPANDVSGSNLLSTNASMRTPANINALAQGSHPQQSSRYRARCGL
jgi:hypothetical protein